MLTRLIVLAAFLICVVGTDICEPIMILMHPVFIQFMLMPSCGIKLRLHNRISQ